MCPVTAAHCFADNQGNILQNLETTTRARLVQRSASKANIADWNKPDINEAIAATTAVLPSWTNLRSSTALHNHLAWVHFGMLANKAGKLNTKQVLLWVLFCTHTKAVTETSSHFKQSRLLCPVLRNRLLRGKLSLLWYSGHHSITSEIQSRVTDWWTLVWKGR